MAIVDNNRIPVLLGTSNTDGFTTVPITVSPTDNHLLVSDGTTGSDLTGDDAPRDEDRVTGMMGVSSVDGVTPVPIYVDSVTGQLLIKTT